MDVVRLEVAGPGSMVPGGAEQFRVTAHLLDGSQRDATAEAAWSSANASIVSISSAGLATAHDRGETDVRAALSEVISTKRVLVLTPGTFKVSGRVSEGFIALTDARVEVTAGSAAGLSTLSQDGHYALYGLSGPTQIRASKDGYHPQIQSVEVTDHRSLDLQLLLARPIWDPSGRYTLTMAAAAECRAALPEEARVRTYTAALTMNPVYPRNVVIGLSAPNLETSDFSWPGTIGETTVSFESRGYYGDTLPLVERLAPSTFLLVWLTKAEVARSPAGLDGSFAGTLQVGQGDTWYNVTRTAQCASANHRFTFSR